MTKTRFHYPPCAVNPRTEKPYARHKWEIVDNVPMIKNGLYYYRVRCSRKTCEVNDPNPIGY
jgi:hypothetical protein